MAFLSQIYVSKLQFGISPEFLSGPVLSADRGQRCRLGTLITFDRRHLYGGFGVPVSGIDIGSCYQRMQWCLVREAAWVVASLSISSIAH